MTVSTLARHQLVPLSEQEIRQAIAEGRVMTAEQAADWLKVDRVTVRTLITKKRLRPIRKGMRPLLFLEDDVHECVEFRVLSGEPYVLDDGHRYAFWALCPAGLGPVLARKEIQPEHMEAVRRILARTFMPEDDGL